MQYPDYTNCLLGIPSSVLRHYGARPEHATLPILDARLNRKNKNVVVMVLDGFGSAILDRYKEDAPFLFANKAADLSSVFPPTTTAATTSLITGLSPTQHGWLGWSLYFEELNENVELFPNLIDDTETPAASYGVAGRYLPFEDIFSRINTATENEVQAESVYPFSGYCTKTSKEMCEVVARLCQRPGRQYVHAYWADPDAIMHRNGVGHEAVRECIRALDHEIESLSSTLTDTLLIVTADHGMVDTQYLLLTDHPELTETLVRPPSIETRAVNFFIKPGQEARFAQLFLELFADKGFALFDRDEVIAKRLFGEGEAHPRFEGFLGQFLAVAHGPYSLNYAVPKTHPVFKAMHAGMHPDEMTVPLIMIG